MAAQGEGSSKDSPSTAPLTVEAEEPPLSAEADQPPTFEAEVRNLRYHNDDIQTNVSSRMIMPIMIQRLV